MNKVSLIKWVIRITLLLVLLVVTPAALALDGRSGDSVTIAADEVIDDDLYISGSEVKILGTVNGDVFIAGQNILVEGTINGDFFAGGQLITVNGTISDDVRIAGTVLTIAESANVGSDVLMFGYSGATERGSVVGGDLLFGGLQLHHAGSLAGDLDADAGGVVLDGIVAGNVNVVVAPQDEVAAPPVGFIPGVGSVPAVPMGLTIPDTASVGGDLDYTTSDTIAVPASTVLGEISRHVPETPAVVVTPPTRTEQILGWVGAQLQRFIGLALIGLLSIWLAPMWLRRATTALGERPVSAFGWGLAVFVGVLVGFGVLLLAMILLAALFGWLTLGNLVGTTIVLGLFAIMNLALLFGLAIAYFTKITVSLCFGSWLLGLVNPRWREAYVSALFVGLFAFVLLTAIPVVGGWLSFIIVLMGFGTFWLLGRAMASPELVEGEKVITETKLGPTPA